MPPMILLYPVILLVLGAVVLASVTRIASVKTTKVLALVVAAGCLISCLLLYWDQPTAWSAELWRPGSLFGVELSYRSDSLSVGFLSLTAFIAVMAVLSEGRFLSPDEDSTSAYAALFLVLAGACSVLLSADLVTLCLSWGFLELCFLALTALAREGRAATRTGLRLLLFNYVSGVALLAALLALQRQAHSFSLDATPFPSRVVSLMVLAALLRLGLYPAFVALPSSVRMRTPEQIVWHLVPVSVGGYVLARALSLTAVAALPGREMALVLGSLALILSPFPLWFERGIGSLAAFVVLNQVGHMALVAAVATPYSVPVIASQTVGLALAVTLLSIAQTTARGAMPPRFQVWKRCCVLVALATLVATPLTVGFVGRQLLYQSLMESHLGPLILLSLVANSFLVAPLLKMGLEHPSQDDNQREVPPVLLGSITALAVLLVLFGVYPPLLGLFMGAQSALAAWPSLPSLVYSAQVPSSLVLSMATLLSLAAGYLLYRKGEAIVGRAGITLETLQVVARMEWLFRALRWAGQQAAYILEQVSSFLEGTRSPGWILLFATLVAVLLLST
jgi:formate hydrogenlyase subunit 3/multisubunit Na+/H+ antiporter MnhD subunit